MLECSISHIANWYFGSDCTTESYSDCTQEKKKLCVVQYLNYGNYVSFSWWDQSQIGIKLGAKHVTYLKLASFIYKKDVYINRLDSVFYDM